MPDITHGAEPSKGISRPPAAPTAQTALALTDLAPELRAHGVMLTYRQLYDRVLAGRIPAQRIGRKPQWMIQRADLPAIIAALSSNAARAA